MSRFTLFIFDTFKLLIVIVCCYVNFSLLSGFVSTNKTQLDVNISYKNIYKTLFVTLFRTKSSFLQHNFKKDNLKFDLKTVQYAQVNLLL